MPIGHGHFTQFGGGLPEGILKYHTGAAIQSGSGIGALFGSLFSKLIPFATRATKAAVSGIKQLSQSQIARDLKDTAISAATNYVADKLQGSEDASANLQSKLETAKSQIADALRQSGNKRTSVDNNVKKAKKIKTRKKFKESEEDEDFDLLGGA